MTSDVLALQALVRELQRQNEELQRQNKELLALRELDSKRIEALEAEGAELRSRLDAEVTLLKAQNAELARQTKMNSSNSSKPPSSDPPWQKPSQTEKNQQRRERKKRKQGAQKGHKGHHREQLPPNEVDEVVNCVPQGCDKCGGHEVRVADEPWRIHQVIELVDGKKLVTEYRIFDGSCSDCEGRVFGVLPDGVLSFVLGPRFSAVVALLTGKYRISKRRTRELLYDLFDITISVGTICAVEKRMTQALEPAMREAEEFIRQHDIVNLDETGWREKGRRAWLWVAVTMYVVVFHIAERRNADVAKKILGEGFAGIIGTDQLGSYNWVDELRHQLCWSHLLRKFKGFAESADADIACWGRRLHAYSALMFKWWFSVRDGTLSREDFNRRMKDRLIPAFNELLFDAADSELPGLERSCSDLFMQKASLWVFVHNEKVAPTNNVSEQEVRDGVIRRKISFGTQSQTGSRFIECTLTTTASLRRQKRSVLNFLDDTYNAHFNNLTKPSLLPQF